MIYFYEIRIPLKCWSFMNDIKKQIWFPVLLSVSLIVGMIFGYKLKENMGDFSPSIGKSKSMNSKLNEILYLIESKYVDSISADTLKKITIESLIARLDPHSSYIPVEHLAGMNDELQGNFNGIGVQFEIIQDTVTIISLHDKSPAISAGLEIGDKILKVNNTVVSSNKMSESEIKNLVRGKKGSKLTLTVERNGNIFSVELQRSRIVSSNIDAAYFLSPSIAYIRISKFSGNSYEEFMEHLEKMKLEGMEKLILDLRDNGGGILDDAVQIADEFLEGTKEIVSTKGSNMPLQVYSARRPGLFEKGKLIILINENTASASEVLAGALQDWNRATIIGRRSFGKGLVQEQFSLSDGGALRLTIARYYTPIGRSIQKPYKNGVDSQYSGEILHRLKDGELFDQNHRAHYGKAFTTQDGRTLYSEEGISPDVFMPIDSIYWQIFHQNDTIHDLLTTQALKFYRNNLPGIKKLIHQNDLHRLIHADKKLTDTVYTLAQSLKTENMLRSREILINEIENILSWMIWKKQGYYKSINQKDPILVKAMELVKKD